MALKADSSPTPFFRSRSAKAKASSGADPSDPMCASRSAIGLLLMLVVVVLLLLLL